MTYILIIILSASAGWLTRDFLMKRTAHQVTQFSQPSTDQKRQLDPEAREPKTTSERSANARKQDDAEKIPLVIAELTELEPEKSFNVYLSYGDGMKLCMVMGYFEAQSIAIEMKGFKAARPLTFDLLQTLILAGHFVVKEIVIDAIINQLFYATVVLQGKDGELELDTRPSDALVIALKNKAPMYVYRSVINAYRN